MVIFLIRNNDGIFRYSVDVCFYMYYFSLGFIVVCIQLEAPEDFRY